MIRPATLDDVREIARLLAQLWPTRKIDLSAVETLTGKYINNSHYLLFVYERDGQLLGLISISFRWSFYQQAKAAIIEELIVNESERKTGIGRKLVDFAEKKIRQKPEVRGIELSSALHREATHSFWEHLGYSKSSYHFEKKIR